MEIGNEEREFSNFSDFLFEHGRQIQAQYRGTPSASWMADYTRYQAEIDLLLNLMEAVRLLPGLDLPDVPGVTNMFEDKLAAALSKYRQARPDSRRS